MQSIYIQKWPVVSFQMVEGTGMSANPKLIPSKITQEFKTGGVHPGVDIAIPGHLRDGDAVVVACSDGVVEEVYDAANGRTVVIGHDGGWRSGYVHLQPEAEGYRHAYAQVGKRVKAGDPLGRMGKDPGDPEGIMHLHFQIGVGEARTPVDPAPYLMGLTRT